MSKVIYHRTAESTPGTPLTNSLSLETAEKPYHQFLSPLTLDIFLGIQGNTGKATFEIASQKGIQRFRSNNATFMSIALDVSLFSIVGGGVRFLMGGLSGMDHNEISNDFQIGDTIYSSRIFGDYNTVTYDLFVRTPPLVIAKDHNLQLYYLINLGQEFKNIKFVGGELNSGIAEYESLDEDRTIGEISFINHQFGLRYLYTNSKNNFFSIGLDLFGIYTTTKFTSSDNGKSRLVYYPDWMIGAGLIITMKPLDFLWQEI